MGFRVTMLRVLLLLAVVTPAFAQTPPPECCTAEQLALIGVNASDILECFGWGFGVVVLFWSFGYCVGVGIDLIKKV